MRQLLCGQVTCQWEPLAVCQQNPPTMYVFCLSVVVTLTKKGKKSYTTGAEQQLTSKKLNLTKSLTGKILPGTYIYVHIPIFAFQNFHENFKNGVFFQVCNGVNQEKPCQSVHHLLYPQRGRGKNTELLYHLSNLHNNNRQRMKQMLYSHGRTHRQLTTLQ